MYQWKNNSKNLSMEILQKSLGQGNISGSLGRFKRPCLAQNSKMAQENKMYVVPRKQTISIVLAESLEQTDQHQSQEEEERTARNPEGGSSRVHG